VPAGRTPSRTVTPHQCVPWSAQRALISVGDRRRDRRLLIADEPTTSSTSTLQAHIRNFWTIAGRSGPAVLLISSHARPGVVVPRCADHVLRYEGRRAGGERP